MAENRDLYCENCYYPKRVKLPESIFTMNVTSNLQEMIKTSGIQVAAENLLHDIVQNPKWSDFIKEHPGLAVGKRW